MMIVLLFLIMISSVNCKISKYGFDFLNKLYSSDKDAVGGLNWHNNYLYIRRFSLVHEQNKLVSDDSSVLSGLG